MNHHINPLYFWAGVIGVAGLPFLVALGMPMETAVLTAAGFVGAVLIAIAMPIVARLVLDHWTLWGKSQKTGVPTCRKCGYDLRASPFRCPECGERVPSTDRLILQYIQRLQKP